MGTSLAHFFVWLHEAKDLAVYAGRMKDPKTPEPGLMRPQEAVSPMEASWQQVSRHPTHQHLWKQEGAPSFITSIASRSSCQPMESGVSTMLLVPSPMLWSPSGEEVPWVNI